MQQTIDEQVNQRQNQVLSTQVLATMLQQMQWGAGLVQRQSARVSISKDVTYSGSLTEDYNAWIAR